MRDKLYQCQDPGQYYDYLILNNNNNNNNNINNNSNNNNNNNNIMIIYKKNNNIIQMYTFQGRLKLTETVLVVIRALL